MNPRQATKFADAFGYHKEFLTSGEGCLMEYNYKNIRIGSEYEKEGREIGNYFRGELGNLIACRFLSMLNEDAYNAFMAFISHQDDKYLDYLKRFLSKFPDRKLVFPGEDSLTK